MLAGYVGRDSGRKGTVGGVTQPKPLGQFYLSEIQLELLKEKLAGEYIIRGREVEPKPEPLKEAA